MCFSWNFHTDHHNNLEIFENLSWIDRSGLFVGFAAVYKRFFVPHVSSSSYTTTFTVGLCWCRMATATASVFPPLVSQTQTVPPCWTRRTAGSQGVLPSLHKRTGPWDPVGAPDAAPYAAEWTASPRAPASGDPRLRTQVKSNRAGRLTKAADILIKFCS